MATVTKPVALDESINTTENTPRNIADVLADELSNIADKIQGGQIPLHYPADRVYLDGDTTKNVQDKVARKADLTNLDLTGTTNTTGSTIASGTYFYLNGVLVRAKTAIASGATFTEGTNYEVVTVGGLNSVTDELNKLKIKTKSFSGTTGNKGQILMMSNISTTIIPIFVKIDGGAYTMISFDGTGTSLYAHLENDNGVIANTSVSGTLYYFKQ